MAALKALNIPVLRWPGGCFADEYHWHDGIGPREKRPSMINTHWGGVVENNRFGTHEFMDLVDQLGTDAYITGNVGSGTAQEMMEWVEYLTSDASSPMANLRRQNGRDKPWRVPYFGVGNEPWGCGGNMRPEYYADEFRQVQHASSRTTTARSPSTASRAAPTATNYNWTEVMMGAVGPVMNGLSLHYYTLPTGNWRTKGSATQFDEDQWFSTLSRTLRLDELIARTRRSWTRPTRRSASASSSTSGAPGTTSSRAPSRASSTSRTPCATRWSPALNFHIFHRHADRVKMANIAQTVNVLQAMILTDKEKMLRTPTYWVFEMFKVHQGGTFLPVELQSPDYAFGGEKIPAVSASATRAADGRAVHLSLVNTHPRQPATLTVTLAGVSAASVAGRVLTAPTMQAHNTFAAPDTVRPVPFEGVTLAGSTLTVTLPAKSVAVLELK